MDGEIRTLDQAWENKETFAELKSVKISRQPSETSAVRRRPKGWQGPTPSPGYFHGILLFNRPVFARPSLWMLEP